MIMGQQCWDNCDIGISHDCNDIGTISNVLFIPQRVPILVLFFLQISQFSQCRVSKFYQYDNNTRMYYHHIIHMIIIQSIYVIVTSLISHISCIPTSKLASIMIPFFFYLCLSRAVHLSYQAEFCRLKLHDFMRTFLLFTK